MSVRVNIPMSQFMRTLIQLGVRTYVRTYVTYTPIVKSWYHSQMIYEELGSFIYPITKSYNNLAGISLPWSYVSVL